MEWYKRETFETSRGLGKVTTSILMPLNNLKIFYNSYENRKQYSFEGFPHSGGNAINNNKYSVITLEYHGLTDTEECSEVADESQELQIAGAAIYRFRMNSQQFQQILINFNSLQNH